MFHFEAEYASFRRRYGAEAGRYYLGILPGNEPDSTQYGPQDGSGRKPELWGERMFFDFNEHFIELSNPCFDMQIFGFVMLVFLGGGILGSGYLSFDIVYILLFKPPLQEMNTVIDVLIIIFGLIGSLVFAIGMAWVWKILIWPFYIRPSCFTMLRGRIRFNRDTRKVYVLRPKFCGGNVVLDWDRVRAMPHWYISDVETSTGANWKRPWSKEKIQQRAYFSDHALVLYWPPFDLDDPTALGEEAIFVGPTIRGSTTVNLWEYIRHYMEKGPESVEAPVKFLPQGLLGMDDIMGMLNEPFRDYAKALKEATAEDREKMPWLSGQAMANFDSVTAPIWSTPATIILWFAQILNYWPSFPKEWNSDSGIGDRRDRIPEEDPDATQTS